jgi:hypothetical protein
LDEQPPRHSGEPIEQVGETSHKPIRPSDSVSPLPSPGWPARWGSVSQITSALASVVVVALTAFGLHKAAPLFENAVLREEPAQLQLQLEAGRKEEKELAASAAQQKQLAWDFVCGQVAADLNSIAQARLQQANIILRYPRGAWDKLATFAGLSSYDYSAPHQHADDSFIPARDLSSELTVRDALRLPQLLRNGAVLNDQDRERFIRFHKGFADADKTGLDQQLSIRWQELDHPASGEAELGRVIGAAQQLAVVASDYRRACRDASISPP